MRILSMHAITYTASRCTRYIAIGIILYDTTSQQLQDQFIGRITSNELHPKIRSDLDRVMMPITHPTHSDLLMDTRSFLERHRTLPVITHKAINLYTLYTISTPHPSQDKIPSHIDITPLLGAQDLATYITRHAIPLIHYRGLEDSYHPAYHAYQQAVIWEHHVRHMIPDSPAMV